MLITCRKCQTRVEEESISVFGFHYHPKCFSCFDCNTPLGNYYFEIDRLPFCELDFKKPRGPVTPITLKKQKPSSSSSPTIASNNSKRFSVPLSPSPSTSSPVQAPDKASFQSYYNLKKKEKEPGQISELNPNSNIINKDKTVDICCDTKIHIHPQNQQPQQPIIVNSVSVTNDKKSQFDISVDSILDSLDEMSQSISSPFYLSQPTRKSLPSSHSNNNIQSHHHHHTITPSHQHQHEIKPTAQEYTATISVVNEPKQNIITKSSSINSISAIDNSPSHINHSGTNNISNNYQINLNPKQHTMDKVGTSQEIQLQHIHPHQLTKGSSIGSGGSGNGMKSYTISYIKDGATSSTNRDLSQGGIDQQYQCHKCRKEIFDKIIINSIGERFHTSCFTCYICRDELVTAYHTDENGYLCSPCQIILNDRNNASRKANGHCSTCYKRFNNGEEYIQIDTEKYHKECFKCCSCKSVIREQNYSRDKVTSTMSNYCCSNCLNSGKVDQCPGCKGAIVGGASIFCLGITYHPHCFKCSVCSTIIPHGSKFTNDQFKNPICNSCSK